MKLSLKKTWITEHRGWEDFFSAALGVVILLSPVVVGGDVEAVVSISTGLVGVVITAVALLELMSLRRWEEFLELLCGAWVAVAPFVLQYGGALRLWHVALGAAVVLLALLELWQDRNRRLDA